MRWWLNWAVFSIASLMFLVSLRIWMAWRRCQPDEPLREVDPTARGLRSAAIFWLLVSAGLFWLGWEM
jgi:hypothetical protein